MSLGFAGVDPTLEELNLRLRPDFVAGHGAIAESRPDGVGVGSHIIVGLEGDVFDEFRIGLDHIAFGCASREELESWPARLDGLGIKHGQILDRSYGAGLAFRDPDNIQLEIFLPMSA
jgi:catechol 2,3-dioxygenase-like lactoylglutathione lyase family enzyme